MTETPYSDLKVRCSNPICVEQNAFSILLAYTKEHENELAEAISMFLIPAFFPDLE